ncbi:MAG: methylated-DNA--[protein]-cysteine S-methyltransferase [Ectothiorhodospiraceae bacterium]|nr:methylated-DNA--[protein]-cysteine S-methyltransferase [Ectothiorhodospiraceae bacterium]
MSQHADIVASLCRHIDISTQPPSLEELARLAGWSSYHTHRVFRQITGLTPRAYAEARRGERVRQRLAQGDSVTDTVYEVGYGSSSRFYAAATRLLGMTPSRYRAGGAGEQILFAVGQCSLGAILVAASQQGVCAISLGDDPDTLVRELQDRFPQANLQGGDDAFENLVAAVVGFVEAPEVGLDLPLDIRGTVFQQRVWQALRDIPPGETVSYTELAHRLGAPSAVRAVAGACAANRLAVAIPCHRVVRTDGGLAGYYWGVARKRELLRRERDKSNAGNCDDDGSVRHAGNR